MLQALGKESMASDPDGAERADPGSGGGGLPAAGDAVKAWHGRCAHGDPGRRPDATRCCAAAICERFVLHNLAARWS